ncbi:hypothetical protein N9248_02795, partial [bacterium]|nr:hypothetical protein [bacterium]
MMKSKSATVGCERIINASRKLLAVVLSCDPTQCYLRFSFNFVTLKSANYRLVPLPPHLLQRSNP